MKVVFVFPDWVDVETTIEHNKKGHGIGHFNFAIAALSASVKRAGHETVLMHVTREPEENAFKEAARVHRDAALFLFSFTQVEVPWVRYMCRWIHESTGALCVGGGIFSTLFPEQSLTDIGLDIVCVGEGDYALPQLCDSVARGRSNGSIPNLWYRTEGRIVRNPTGEYVRDLDTLPPYDYELFDPKRLKNFASNLPRLYYLCTRNCVYGCAFCANHAKRTVMKCGAQYVRMFSPERVVADLVRYRKQFPFIKVVHFADEIIHHDKGWFATLMGLYREQIALPWRSYAMLKDIDADVVRIMRESGCTRVNVGIEAGAERVRRVYNRPYISSEEIVARVRMLQDAGIDVHTSTLLNAPTETVREMLATIKIAARARTNIAVTGIVVPYPGTQLYDYAATAGVLKDVQVENLGVSIVPADTSDRKVLFFFHAYRLLVELYKWLFFVCPARVRGILEPLFDRVVISRWLPHRLLIWLRVRYFQGRILNRQYRIIEKKLGRQERKLEDAIAALEHETTATIS